VRERKGREEEGDEGNGEKGKRGGKESCWSRDEGKEGKR
jgi:hypothetical protein